MAYPQASFRPQPPFRAIGPGSLIIAHRGGGLEAPENTLAAIQHAIESGTDWQEVDVRLSKDNIPMIFHDVTLERTAHVTGPIALRSANDLRQMCVGQPRQPANVLAWLHQAQLPVPQFTPRQHKETIPTLSQLLAMPGSRLMLELKVEHNAPLLLQKTLQVIAEHQAYQRVAIASDAIELLQLLQQQDPTIPMIGVAETAEDISKMLLLPLSVLAVAKEQFDHAQQILLEQGKTNIALWLWTIYGVEEAETWQEKGACGLITDRPQAVLQALRFME